MREVSKVIFPAVMTGEATRIAASALKARAIEVAAELLQTPAELLDVIDGEVVRSVIPRAAEMPPALAARFLEYRFMNHTPPGQA